MPLTSKDVLASRGVEVYPHDVGFSALLEDDYTIPGVVATNATIALCFKPTAGTVATMIDGSAHHHLVIQKNGTTVKLWKNGKDLPDYTGTVGATYGDFLKNVLTALSGSYHGYYSELHVVEQSLEPSVFGEFSDQVTGLWVLKEVEIPDGQIPVMLDRTLGTLIGTMVNFGGSAAAFDGNTNQVNSSCAACTTSNTGYVGKDWGAGNEKVLSKVVAYSANNNGWADNAGGLVTIAVLGSNTNAPANATVLETVTHNDAATLLTETFTNLGTTAYRYHWLKVREHTYTVSQCGELQFFVDEDITYGDGGGYYSFSNALKLGEDSAQGKTVEDFGNNKLVSGTPSGTTGHISWTIEKAFDGASSTAHGILTDSYPYANGVYTQYKVGTAFVGTKYSITSSGMPGTSYTSWVKSWELHGSNDNWATHDVLDTQTNQTFGNQVTHEYTFSNITSYDCYRIKHLASNHGNYSDIAEFKMWAEPVMVSPNDATMSGTQTVDTPSNAACTWDALYPGCTLSNGNLSKTTNRTHSTMRMESGKWAWKTTAVVTGNTKGLSNLDGSSPTPATGAHYLTLTVGSTYEWFYDADTGVFSYKVNGGALTEIGTGLFGPLVIYNTANSTAQFVGFTPSEADYKTLSSANLPKVTCMKSSKYADLVTRVGDANYGATVMTDYTTNGYTVDASTEYDLVNRKAWMAFDRGGAVSVNGPGCWCSNGATGWLRILCPSPELVTRYSITSCTATGYNPIDWTFEGSDDGANWDALDTQTDKTWMAGGAWVLDLAAPATYKWYRLNVTRSDSAYIIISEVALIRPTKIDLTDMKGGPDVVTTKALSMADSWHTIDKLRGDEWRLMYDRIDAQSLVAGTTKLTSTGYTLGAFDAVNKNTHNFLDLCLKAGVEQGVEAIRYTGNGVLGRDIAHTLGKAPTFMLVKSLATGNWYVYHIALGATNWLELDNTRSFGTNIALWNNTDPIATHFTVGSSPAVNGDGTEYIAYLFTDSDIFEAFSFLGNASTDGPLVNVGGEILSIPFLKNSANASSYWYNLDSERDIFNPIGTYLVPNQSDAEASSGFGDFTSAGFKVTGSGPGYNGSGQLHVGLAIKKRTSKYPQGF